MHFHTFSPYFFDTFAFSYIFTTFFGYIYYWQLPHLHPPKTLLQESVALDAMSGDANALKIGQTLADKFRQAGDKKDL